NSLILKTEELEEILTFLREQFPGVTRITSYCRSQTARRKTVEELQRLRQAGLSRIHVGMESGYDPLLEFIRKGATAADHIEGGKRIVESGISLCEYIIPGLGGDRWSEENALATATVINAINPDYVRLRSLQVVKGTGLYELMQKGEFTPLGDDETVKEIRMFIANLEGIQTTIVSDHILNLLEEVEGKLPEDKDKLLAVIDSYLSLPIQDRMIFRLGRRQGIYRRLDDLRDPVMYGRLKTITDEYLPDDTERFETDLRHLMYQYV
ncbi:MAG: radical SAM protein, partial [Syntrophobacterales bacterium]|nr:radical SAM protein [Syntrophobacterales bacterium]